MSRVGDTGVHIVATWDLIDEALQREADFSANLTGVLVREEGGHPGIFPLGAAGATDVIATADEPEHSVHRALAQPRLAAAQTAKLEPGLRRWTEEALASWVGEGGGAVVPIAEIIPARAVAHVLGLPDGDVSRHRAWAMMGGDILAGAVGNETLVALATETGRMLEYIGEHLDAVTPSGPADPEATLLAALAGGVRRGEIGRDHALGIALVMFGAGGESTAALIGSTVRRIAENEEVADTLRAEPHLVSRFVEEVVRLESPFKFHYRAVRRACELGGVALEPGDRLMLLWASANRDATHFDDPDALRLDRRHPKNHLGFGRGSHFCIGAPLARLEARVVLEDLLSRTKHVGLRPDAQPIYANSIFIRRLERFEVDVEPG